MRLNKKFLFSLAPIAIVGVCTPVFASCAAATFSINYGDTINCLNEKNAKGEKRNDYKSIDDIRRNVVPYLPQQPARPISFSEIDKMWEKTIGLDKDGGKKQLYYDLIASETYIGVCIDLQWIINSDGTVDITLWESNASAPIVGHKLHYHKKRINPEDPHSNYIAKICMETNEGEREIRDSQIYKNCIILD